MFPRSTALSRFQVLTGLGRETASRFERTTEETIIGLSSLTTF
jgi:hypothetical protein